MLTRQAFSSRVTSQALKKVFLKRTEKPDRPQNGIHREVVFINRFPLTYVSMRKSTEAGKDFFYGLVATTINMFCTLIKKG